MVNLLALYVQSRADFTRAAEEAVQENLEFARKLGADVHVVEGGAKDPAAEIIRFAREQRVTQRCSHRIYTQPSSWEGSGPGCQKAVDKLIREAEGMDVRIFS